MSEKYEGKVRFLCVYIKEIHPIDEVPNSVNTDAGIVMKQPTTEDERAENAAVCMLRFNYRFPMLLDDMTNQVETAYAALPERLYLVDAEGKIALSGGPGPHYFDVDELEKAIETEIAKP
jgi:hypothetical protein